MSQKPAARLGDMGGPHGAFVPTPIIQGSPTVACNKMPVARQGDALVMHTRPGSPPPPPHPRSIAGGAKSVLVNGQAWARMGDRISCGGNILAGSGNVMVGDSPKPPKDAGAPRI